MTVDEDDLFGDEPPSDPRPHTWSRAVENLGCGLIAAVFLAVVLALCTWGYVQIVAINHH